MNIHNAVVISITNILNNTNESIDTMSLRYLMALTFGG